MSRGRDIKRIRVFCNELADIWESNCPDWRFGQFIMNVLGKMSHDGRDPFFPEEKEMIEYIRTYFKGEADNDNTCSDKI